MPKVMFTEYCFAKMWGFLNSVQQLSTVIIVNEDFSKGEPFLLAFRYFIYRQKGGTFYLPIREFNFVDYRRFLEVFLNQMDFRNVEFFEVKNLLCMESVAEFLEGNTLPKYVFSVKDATALDIETYRRLALGLEYA